MTEELQPCHFPQATEDLAPKFSLLILFFFKSDVQKHILGYTEHMANGNDSTHNEDTRVFLTWDLLYIRNQHVVDRGIRRKSRGTPTQPMPSGYYSV